MATFKEQLETDNESVFFSTDDFAYSAIFTDIETSTDIDCQILINHESEIQPTGYETAIVVQIVSIEAMISQIGTPRIGDTFTVDSDIYTVKRIESIDEHIAKVIVKKVED